MCEYFLMIYVCCFEFGIDIVKELILVVLVVYYMCGGVVIDFVGCIDFVGLYVVGEILYMGLYGVNWFVSNLLFECLVIGCVVVEVIEVVGFDVDMLVVLFVWDESCVLDVDEEVVVVYNWDELCCLMWNYVGIVCIDKCFECVKYCLLLLCDEIYEYYVNFCVMCDLFELCNFVDVVMLIVKSVYLCCESCGLYYSCDWLYMLLKVLLSVFMLCVCC